MKLGQQKNKNQKVNSKVKSNNQPNSRKLKQQKIQNQKEESLREILGFFMNQVDAKKYFKKKQARDYGEDEKEEKLQDDFLNPNEFAEVKGTYDDYNIGDLAIIFKNPDFDTLENRGVTFKEAEKNYEEMLTVMTDEVSKSQMKKEKYSFLLAFLTLDDFEDKKEEQHQKKKVKKKFNEKLQEYLPWLKKNKTNQQSTLNYDEKEKVENERTSYQKYLDFMKMYKKQEQDQQMEEEIKKNKQTNKGSKKQAYLDEIGIEPDKAAINQNMILDPIKELLKIDLSETHHQFKKVKKKFCKGGYLTKKELDSETIEWQCQNSPPKDFLTLIRFTLMAKLCRNGFLHCRQFINSNGEYIFLIIKSSKAVIMRSAQNMKITKQIELGYADLFSLEPVDHSFRPLRLKTYIRQVNDEEVKKKMQEIQQEESKRNEKKQKNDQEVQDDEESLIFKPNETIEDHCNLLYQKVCSWDTTQLRVKLIFKQNNVDKIMKNIAKQLNIDQSHEKVELINDKDISDEQWQVYYIYMEYLLYYGQLIQQLLDQENQEVKENLAFLYKLIFRKALGSSNNQWYQTHPSLLREITQNKELLFNLWGRLKVNPVAPYTEFFVPNNEANNSMWRRYEVNELGLRSEFINMEKLKITHATVLKNLNILRMIRDLIVVAYFPIHDHYQLREIPKEPFFSKLIEGGFLIPKEDSLQENQLKMLFEQLKDQAEPTDFDSKCLEKQSSFNIRVPWGVPVNELRDYFGEKIALYFLFLSYFTKQLWYMAIIGILAQAFISESLEEAKTVIIILFSIVIIIWSTLFIEFWKRQQILFSVQFGQQNFEEDEAERPAFKGTYIRSITNDDLNEEFYSPFLRKMKQLFSLAVSFLIIACVIASVIGIFSFKVTLIEQKKDNYVVQYVPSILNSIQISFFNFIYQKLVEIFNNFENHKILSSYENSLIAKIFIFMFVNNFNSFFIISFLSGYFSSLQLCKVSDQVPNDCFQVLQNQLMVIFLSNLVKNIPELAIPIVKALVSKKLRGANTKQIDHPFNLIDQAIDEQLDLEPYQTNEEVDGTVNDYMELVIQFSYLALFGLSFPSCFILAFASNIIEVQVDQFKLIRVSRRPFPQGAATIGNWLIILEVITFFGIFSNTGLIVYTSQTITQNQIMIFSILLVLFLAIKYFIRFLVPDEPESAQILNKRHQYVVDKVVKGFASTGQKSFTPAIINLKIQGVNYNDSASENDNQSQNDNNQ